MSTPIVRDIARTDYVQWLPLWDGYNQFYGRSGPTALSDEITATTWARFFDDREPVHCLVAEYDRRLVGLAHFLFHRSTTMISLICYLQDLFTSADARGRGVGRSLIEAVCAHAKAEGAGRIYWHTHETNAAAQRLYDAVADRSGFIVYRKAL